MGDAAPFEGVDPKRASLVARIAFFFTRRKVGRVIAPVTVHAHHPRLLRGYAGMEMAQEAASRLPSALKTLAGVRAATRIGCPF